MWCNGLACSSLCDYISRVVHVVDVSNISYRQNTQCVSISVQYCSTACTSLREKARLSFAVSDAVWLTSKMRNDVELARAVGAFSVQLTDVIRLMHAQRKIVVVSCLCAAEETVHQQNTQETQRLQSEVNKGWSTLLFVLSWYLTRPSKRSVIQIHVPHGAPLWGHRLLYTGPVSTRLSSRTTSTHSNWSSS